MTTQEIEKYLEALLEKYYPRQQIKPATQFFVEELFEQIDQSK